MVSLDDFAVKEDLVEVEVFGKRLKIKKLSGYAFMNLVSKHLIGNKLNTPEFFKELIITTVVEPEFDEEFIKNKMDAKYFLAIGAELLKIHGHEFEEIKSMNFLG